MAVAVGNSTITAFATAKLKVFSAATSSVIDATEVFTITPTKADNKFTIEIYNGSGHGAITYSIAAGNFFASTTAKTGSVAAGTTGIIQVESATVATKTGTILLTLIPASGKRLLTDHASGVSVVELIG